MRETLKKINRKLQHFGIDVRQFVSAATSRTPDWYAEDLKEFLRQRGDDRTFPAVTRSACLIDKGSEGGIMKGDYFHQDLYVARKIFENAPQKHVDIGSRTDGFVAHVAAFRFIEVLDIRPIHSKVKNIGFKRANLMELQPEMETYCDSISSLHAIEHFGLGRYGDPIDYNGHLKAFASITQMLQAGGVFYFSVPIGPQRIEFNELRVFSLRYLVDMVDRDYTIEDFAYVDDAGDLHEKGLLDEQLIASDCGCRYGCGIFTLRKKG
jgi:SAM-dependent methyltransferase